MYLLMLVATTIAEREIVASFCRTEILDFLTMFIAKRVLRIHGPDLIN
jgi:hypothetical protein